MFLCSLRYCLKCKFLKGVYSFTLSTVYTEYDYCSLYWCSFLLESVLNIYLHHTIVLSSVLLYLHFLFADTIIKGLMILQQFKTASVIVM